MSIQRRADVQGLRGLAVLIVVLYHADGIVPGGFIGVDIFFVISGYVITLGLQRQLQDNGRIEIRDFYERRIRRLLPMLALVTTATVAASFLASPIATRPAANSAAIAASTFRANLFFADRGGYFDSTDEINPLLHTWSLSVEEQFYFVLPVGLALLWMVLPKSVDRRRFVAGVLTAIALSSMAFMLVRSGGSDAELRFAFYSPFTRAWQFLAGVIVALVAPAAVASRGQRANALRWIVGLGLALLPAVLLSSSSRFPGLATISVVAGAVLLLIPGSPPRVLAAAPLTWLGDRSYGWYLWHWPAIVFAKQLWPESTTAPQLAAVMSLGLAAVTFIAVEEPIRGAASINGGRAWLLAAVCIVVPIGAARVAQQAHVQMIGTDLPAEVDERSIAIASGCHTRPESAPWSAADCTWDAEFEDSVFLVGDSHASSIGSAVREAARSNELSTTIWSRSACPFSALPRPDVDACDQWQTDVLEAVVAADPSLVIIHNRSTASTMSTVGEPGAPLASGDGSVPSARPVALENWETGLRGVLDALAEEQIPVLLVLTGAEFESSPEETISVLRSNGFDQRLTMDEIAARRGEVNQLERTIAADYANVTVLDPTDTLCDVVCSQRSDDGWLYYDDDHLSVFGAAKLPFEEVFREVLAGF